MKSSTKKKLFSGLAAWKLGRGLLSTAVIYMVARRLFGRPARG